MKRTKTLEQCRSEAMLMGKGWYYAPRAHVFSRYVDIGAGMRGFKSEYWCAETLQPLTLKDATERLKLNGEDEGT